MNLFDIGIILILISFAAIGFKNGVIKETVNFVGLILVFIISYTVKGYIGDILCQYAPFFKFAGSIEGITSFNLFLYQAIAFILVFGILLGVYAVLVKGSAILQKLLNLTIVLIIPSKIAGSIISVIKCWCYLFVILIAMMLPFGNQKLMQESTLKDMILYKTPILSTYTEKFTSSLKEIYDVTKKLVKEDTAEEKQVANIKCLNIMLKYNIVDKKLVEELIDNGKLENIKKTDIQ